ncbi:MAG: DUF4331 domain-containing protein [Deltaproteobacteria bacterium]|nr:DUF4331 domain-containing protein [Deltaproteobacteria bacterium]
MRISKSLTVAGLLSAGTAFASSHREAPLISNDPAADNTDLYAWVSPTTHDKLYVIANYVPLEEPAGGPNFNSFADEVRYEIWISRGDSLDPAVSYQFFFKTTPPPRVDVANQTLGPGGGKEFFLQLSGIAQTYSVVKRVYAANGSVTETTIGTNLPVAPVNIGPRTEAVARGGAAYDDAFTATFVHDLGTAGSEGRVFAGPRDDGFYVDLGGVFDLANLRAKGTAQDGVAGYNTHAIAIEIPTTLLTADGSAPGNTPGNATTLGVYASASRPQATIIRNNGTRSYFAPYKQVSRLGLPLINEAVIGLQDKDRWNADKPSVDVARYGAYFLNPIVVRDAEAVGIYAALGADPDALGLKWNRTDIIDVISLHDGEHSFTAIGDVLRVDMAKDSGFPNGRPIPGGAAANQEQADVTDVLLTVILSKGLVAISDGVDYNDKAFLATFPFLPVPWRGYDEGHGKPTP